MMTPTTFLPLCLLLALSGNNLCTAAGDLDDASNLGSEHDGHLVLQVEHSLDRGDTFQPRGTLTLHSLRSGSSTFAQDTPKQEVMDSLRSLCSDGGLYLLRFSSPGGQVHRAVADACGMVESGLKDVFTVHLDWKSQLVGVSVSSALSAPPRVTNSNKRGSSKVVLDDEEDFASSDGGFDSKVVVQAMESGPQPDTAAFIQRQEQEKLAKQRGETKDNRSFFAKYWMYIVPVVLVMFLSGANPEAQGGGGGGR